MGVTFTPVFNRKGLTNKSGLYSINLRVTIDRKTSYINPKLPRVQWFSCMKYGGGGSPGFDSYFIDTGSCWSCRSERQMKEFEEQRHDDFSMDWSNFISNERVEEEYLVEKIDRLTRLELKTLYKIYELQDFSLVKDSTELFPLKGNTNYEKKVWSYFYTLGQKGLVSLIKNQNYIYGVKLIPGVQNLLSNFQEQKSLVLDHVDFKIPLLRVDEDGQMKYFGSLNSNLDVILKAGNMYEFFATPNDDGSLLLKIINVS